MSSASFKYVYDNRIEMYDKRIIAEPDVQVLDVFLDLDRHYFNEVSQRAKMTHPRTLRSLRKLSESGVLAKEKEANATFYRPTNTPMARMALGIAAYSKMEAFLAKKKTVARALGLLQEQVTSFSFILLFGSQVKGYAGKTSDIDVLVVKEAVSRDDVKRIEDVSELVEGRTGLQVNVHLMTVEEFRARNKLAQEAIENHIVLDGAENFYRETLQ